MTADLGGQDFTLEFRAEAALDAASAQIHDRGLRGTMPGGRQADLPDRHS